MAITEILIQNPSAEHPLRISAQVRRQPEPVETTVAPPARSPYAQITEKDRTELLARGSEPVSVALDQLHEGKTAQWPRWQHDGAPSLAHWVTKEWEKQAKPTEVATAPRGFRLSEEWSAPTPFLTIAANDRATLRLQDSTRYVLESKDRNAALSILNPSILHSLALRVRDQEGKTPATTFVAPTGYGVLVLGAHGGVIEQRPT